MIPGRVSVIIPVYNRGELVRQAVASAMDQNYSKIEVILVDDGSTDDTPEVIGGLEKQHPGVVLGRRRENGGPGLARETGRQAAQGEFIQYLDSDDLLAPEKLERQVAFLRDHPEVDVVYGTTCLVDGEGRVMKEEYKWTGRDVQGLFPGLLVDRWWCTHTPLWRRSFTDRLGPWSAMRHTEDWEYEARAGALGAKLGRVDGVVSYHRAHTGPRLTGGFWLTPADQASFLSTLHGCASAAGVSAETPEMRHFVRWAFACARAAGEADGRAANALLELALHASGSVPARDLRWFARMVKMFGWKVAGRFAGRIRGKRDAKPGHDTLKQSWMEDG
ncbi:MAG TPA: glycosyltransferase family A protein [Kiritimatiellia bacterium]|nr:glycosyltransferase family A protein [Kiritimatiellia bacterium]